MEPEKIRLIITGPKVHEVGYRYWLMNQAMALGIEGFNAINVVDADNHQKVVVMLEDYLESLDAFKASIKENKPERAIVSKIEFEDYSGRVTQLSNFAQAPHGRSIVEGHTNFAEYPGSSKGIAGYPRKSKCIAGDSGFYS